MPQSATHKRMHKNDRGFSLLELLIVVAILLTIAAITVPRTMNAINDINLRFTASNLSGLLQSARMEAVRKNTYYSVQSTTLPTGENAYYVNVKTPVTQYVAGDPVLPLSSDITVHVGPGSGAPNETTITCGSSCTFNPGADNPSFNARGIPCIVASTSCPAAAGTGYAIFLSRPALTGNIAWASVVITASGHIQIWTCDASGDWIQRD
jgi:prepilin-type N-terminal cleavage/methylation domain-containing protein